MRPALGFAPRPGGAFVANLAARSRGRARKRRDRGRVIVRLDLHEDVDGLVDRAVDVVLGIREVALAQRAFDDRGVVAVGGEHALRILLVRVADHREQRFRLALAVDDPVGVEDLVAAVLGVRLREHHELDVGGIALRAPRSSSPGSRSRRPTARGRARCSRPPAHRGRRASDTVRSGAWLRADEQPRRLGAVEQRGLGHAVEQRRRQRAQSRRATAASRGSMRPDDAALDAAHGVESAHVRDVGGLARPGRNGAEARHDDDLGCRRPTVAAARLRADRRSAGARAARVRARRDRAPGRRSGRSAALMAPSPGLNGFERGAQFGDAEIGDCGGAGKLDHWRARIVRGWLSTSRRRQAMNFNPT